MNPKDLYENSTPRKIALRLIKLTEEELNEFGDKCNHYEFDFIKEQLCDYYSQLYYLIKDAKTEKKKIKYSSRQRKLVPILGYFA